VVAVARKGEAPLSQIAKDFGISESCLHRWPKLADVDDGARPGVTSSEAAELRELKSGTGCSSRRTRSCAGMWSTILARGER
jgi:transposase-like protein